MRRFACFVCLVSALVSYGSSALADVPPDMHEEKKPRKGFIIAGSAVAGGVYLGGIIATAATQGCLMQGLMGGKDRSCNPSTKGPWWMAVPYAGPLIVAANNPKEEVGGYVFVTAAQVIGTGLVVAGYLFPKTQMVSNNVNVSASPLPGGGELRMGGSF